MKRKVTLYLFATTWQKWKKCSNLSLFRDWKKLRTVLPSKFLFLVGLGVGSCVDLWHPWPVEAIEVVWLFRPRLWEVVPPPASLLVIRLPAVPVLQMLFSCTVSANASPQTSTLLSVSTRQLGSVEAVLMLFVLMLLFPLRIWKNNILHLYTEKSCNAGLKFQLYTHQKMKRKLYIFFLHSILLHFYFSWNFHLCFPMIQSQHKVKVY